MCKKIAHFYWGRNKPLSYLRSLSVRSFHKLNPDWEIFIWTPSLMSKEISWKTSENKIEYRGHDYLLDLEKDGFFVRSINTALIGIPSDIPEVHKSDLLRWYLLSMYEGIWSDFDILYVNPITDEMTTKWSGAGVCRYPLGHIAIGFLICEGNEGRDFYSKVFTNGLNKIPQKSYQAFGSDLLESCITPDEPVFVFPWQWFYPYHRAFNIPKYFMPIELDSTESIGFHWYGGHPSCGVKENSVTHSNLHTYSQLYGICKEAVRICR
jgi:hypothetical protein